MNDKTETPPNDPPANPTPDWMNDEGIADYMQRNGFGDDVSKALNAGIAMEKKLGVPQDRLTTLPETGLEADREGWSSILARMGVPETADKYAFEAVTLGEGEGARSIEIADDQIDILREGAKALDLTPSQAQGVIEKMYAPLAQKAMEAEAQRNSEATQRAEAATEALQKEWGNAFDDKLAAAEAEIDQLADDFGLGENFRAELEATGFQNEAWLVRLLSERADARREPSDLPGGKGARSPNTARTPAEMRADARAFADKHADALNDKTHANHAWAVQERLKIIQSGLAK